MALESQVWLLQPPPAAIVHWRNESNQTLLAFHQLGLVRSHNGLLEARRPLQVLAPESRSAGPAPSSPMLGHVDLPHIGSTEAITTTCRSAEHKDELMARYPPRPTSQGGRGSLSAAG